MSTQLRVTVPACPPRTLGRVIRSLILTLIFSLGITVHPSLVRSAEAEHALQRSVVERNQQSEALSNRVRQDQQLFDARSRGANPQQLRDIEARHLRQRVEQDSTNSRQLSEFDRLGAQPHPRSPGMLEAEVLRGERARTLNQQRAAQDAPITPSSSPPPSWTPTLQKRER